MLCKYFLKELPIFLDERYLFPHNDTGFLDSLHFTFFPLFVGTFQNGNLMNRNYMFSILSYRDTNTFYSNAYRSYSVDIPSFLHNRPRNFVVHAMQRMCEAENADLSGIFCKCNGVFSVLSFTDGKTPYQFDFGDSDRMPSCTCRDWKNTGYPCKHFFVIGRKFPAWSRGKVCQISTLLARFLLSIAT